MPMPWAGQYCAAVNCPNSRRSRPGLSFFRFPKDEDRCRKWVQNCGRTDLAARSAQNLFKNVVLCGDHFEDSHFMNSVQRNRLVWSAVPTKFSMPTSLQADFPKKRCLLKCQRYSPVPAPSQISKDLGATDGTETDEKFRCQQLGPREGNQKSGIVSMAHNQTEDSKGFLTCVKQETDHTDVIVSTVEATLKCPVTQLMMEHPVQNKHCGHRYDRQGIGQLIKDRGRKTRRGNPGLKAVAKAHEEIGDNLLPLRCEKQETDHKDVIVTTMEASLKCPITQLVMKHPVRNKHCGHCYDRQGIEQLIKDRGHRARCPIQGCFNTRPLNLGDTPSDYALQSQIQRKLDR